MRKLSILLLADDQKGHAGTIHDHIQAFRRYSRHEVTLLNPRGLRRSRFLSLDAFDAVVIHYSIVAISDAYLSLWFRDALAAYGGLKIQFLQDEYRWVDAITAMSRELGVHVLYSVVPPDNVAAIYGGRLPDTEVVFTLTGYVPEEPLKGRVLPTADRPIDVGYRGRSTPWWLGRLAFEKIEIGRAFLRNAPPGLRVDIAWTENARIYGSDWTRWLASCRATLASESGSSIVDFDGSVEQAVRAYLADRPAASYQEIERDVLSTFPPTVSINTASPRIFEAAAVGTALIMFPGTYSGVVEPWQHYIPLAKDFSNIDDVIDHVRDTAYLEKLTARAHDDLIASGQYSYARFIESFDELVAERVRGAPGRGSPRRLGLRLEQLSAGRGYSISTVYDLGRRTLLAMLGLRYAARSRALRILLGRAARERSHPGAPSLWEDVFRLALMTAVAERSIRTPEPFTLVAAYDRAARRLTFSSALSGPNGQSPGLDHSWIEASARAGEIGEILWNHAPLGQYVTIILPGGRASVGIDVGRYDAFGIYRFERLAEIGSREPGLLADALAPLLVQSSPPDIELTARSAQ